MPLLSHGRVAKTAWEGREMLAGRATPSRLAALARYSSGVRGSHSSLLGFPRPMKAERVMPCVFSLARGRAAILLLILLDADLRFSVSGEYLLRAYPIAVGPTMPAQFAGVLRGDDVTLTVAVNDTIEKRLVVLGPVTVAFGREPNMGPCPICESPTHN